MPTSQEHIDQLQTLRKQFISRIEAIESDVHHKEEPVEKDFAEQVTQRENDDVGNQHLDERTGCQRHQRQYNQ